jgi:hypothetical protein
MDDYYATGCIGLRLSGVRRFTCKRCIECGTDCTTQCSRCKDIYYCSKECQTTGLKYHKRTCGVEYQTRFSSSECRVIYGYLLSDTWSAKLARKYPQIDVTTLVARCIRLRCSYPLYAMVISNALSVYRCPIDEVMTCVHFIFSTSTIKAALVLLEIPAVREYALANSRKYIHACLLDCPALFPVLVNMGIDCIPWSDGGDAQWRLRLMQNDNNELRNVLVRKVSRVAEKQRKLKATKGEWRPHNNATLPPPYRAGLRTLMCLAKARDA